MYRDEETLEAIQYYVKLPDDLGERDAIVLDPMLATGNSSVAAIEHVKKAGARSVTLVCLVAAPEGIDDACTTRTPTSTSSAPRTTAA